MGLIMKGIRMLKPIITYVFAVELFIANFAIAQTTEISSEFLMTLHIPNSPSQEIDALY